ncbi:hypothetical protein KSS87_001769 [Heliosperma pusillum]|nr:hypothetical protein KSS87_001769 [Heliosperma pusillum]
MAAIDDESSISVTKNPPENAISTAADEELRLLDDVVRSIPPLVVKDLLSLEVCPQCVLRLLGKYGPSYCNSSSIFSLFSAVFGGQLSCDVPLSEESEKTDGYCSVCFGILQFIYADEKQSLVKKDCANDLAVLIAELAREEGHKVDDFTLEVSIPPIIAENDNAKRLFIKEKYGSEVWFQDVLQSEALSVKDALKISITEPLETLLGVKSGTSSFRVRLTYTSSDYPTKTVNERESKQAYKKQRTGMLHFIASCFCSSLKNSLERWLPMWIDYWQFRTSCVFYYQLYITVLVILDLFSRREIVSLESRIFAWSMGVADLLVNYFVDKSHTLPLRKKKKKCISNDIRTSNGSDIGANLKDENSLTNGKVSACFLTIQLHRTPIYIGGRYLKLSRNVSQTRWIIDDERMGEASVEEILASGVLPLCRGDNCKFHAAGREDIDVRMLGSGRPFLLEIQNPKVEPSQTSLREMEFKINNSESKLVKVKNLKVVNDQGWTLMREGEAEKQKQYAALVWISRELVDKDLETISSLKDLQVLQRTPVRVLHRRSPLEREKIIHWMDIEKISGSSQYFLLHLCTQAGTYIKEFVHGDLGRTQPSLGSILGCRAEILQLDVTDVKMDCFLTE